ncbi:MAG: hypothetical protein H0X70_01210 [Segetibacter sp.]|nr:hypothetical protein [Segetibacter sp.]
MSELIITLSEEQLQRNIASGFPCIIKQLLHI